MTALLVLGAACWLVAAGMAIGLARAAARNELAPRGGPSVIGRDVYLDYLDPMDPDVRP